MDSVAENLPTPHWLDDAEPNLPRRVLERFIDSLDKGRPPRALRISNTTTPELYRFDDQDAVNFQWELLIALDKEYGVISLQCEPLLPGREIYENARIRFTLEKEKLVRRWLNRPTVDPYVRSWNSTLATLSSHFEDGGRALAENIIRCEYSAEQTLKAFASLGRELVNPTTLRALSARCFWGDSKFLDNRESLVRALYPERSRQLVNRPVLMNVSLPDDWNTIVFVENQDSFLALCELRVAGLAVVYSAGFRGSALRIRERGNAVFSYLGQSSSHVISAFEAWWFENEQTASCYFWGDLDFSGMAILKALRNIFPAMEAWQPGYQPMLDQLLAGNGHSPKASNKSQQVDPVATGCPFADDVLLARIRENLSEECCFVDQEAVRPESLRSNPHN